jgi:hypothetical protein
MNARYLTLSEDRQIEIAKAIKEYTSTIYDQTQNSTAFHHVGGRRDNKDWYLNVDYKTSDGSFVTIAPKSIPEIYSIICERMMTEFDLEATLHIPIFKSGEDFNCYVENEDDERLPKNKIWEGTLVVDFIVGIDYH